MDWYPHYIRDYRRSTRHLTTIEHGAYRLLIDAYMEDGEPLPDDDAVLARIVGLNLDEWSLIAVRIRAFFVRADGHLKHRRCEHELSEQQQQRFRWLKWQRNSRARKLLKEQGTTNADGQQLSGNVSLQDRTGQDSNKKERDIDIAAVSLTKNWQPGEAVKMWATLKCIPDEQLAEHVEHFRSYYLGKGETRADWDETFKSWLIKSKQFKPATAMNGAHYPRKEDNTDAVRRGVDQTIRDIAEAAGRSGVRPRADPQRNALAVLDAKADQKR